MLGSKNLLRRSAGFGAAALLVLAASPAFAAAKASGDASAVTATGIFERLLDTGICESVFPTGAATGTGGAGLNSNEIDAFTQTADANSNGTSSAQAAVSPINLTDPAFTLNLADLALALQNNTLQNIVGPIGGTLGTV